MQSLRPASKYTLHVRFRAAHQRSLLIISGRLQCGHVCCSSCLEKHFESTMQLFIATHSWYRPPPAEYIQVLREPFLDPDLYLDAARWIRSNPTPRYQCVHCHEFLTRSPVHAFYIGSAIATLGQETCTSETGSCPWPDDFFDKYLLF